MQGTIKLSTASTAGSVRPRRRLRAVTASVAVLAATIGVAFAQRGQMPEFDMDQLRAERPLQERTPVMAYADRVPGEEWVPASVTTSLQPGQRIEIATMEEIDEVVIQRLTDRTYFVWSNVYTLTMWVGDQGVLLIDTPMNFPVDKFLREDIKRVTDLPVQAVVYSHIHVDHVAGARRLAEVLAMMNSI